MKDKTIEDYVELLYDIEKEKGKVHTNDVANSLGVNPASVTEIFQKLSQEGYIYYEKYSGVTLTSKGKKIAIKTKEKHEKITEFLILLGVNKKIAQEDACEMEHFLHPSTMDIIIKFVEIVKNCKYTPFWLERLKEYVKTGDVPDCPPDLYDACLKYANRKK